MAGGRPQGRRGGGVVCGPGEMGREEKDRRNRNSAAGRERVEGSRRPEPEELRLRRNFETTECTRR